MFDNVDNDCRDREKENLRSVFSFWLEFLSLFLTDSYTYTHFFTSIRSYIHIWNHHHYCENNRFEVADCNSLLLYIEIIWRTDTSEKEKRAKEQLFCSSYDEGKLISFSNIFYWITCILVHTYISISLEKKRGVRYLIRSTSNPSIFHTRCKATIKILRWFLFLLLSYPLFLLCFFPFTNAFWRIAFFYVYMKIDASKHTLRYSHRKSILSNQWYNNK